LNEAIDAWVCVFPLLQLLALADVQLDKATLKVGGDNGLAELLAALEDTLQNNEFLLNFEQLNIAMWCLTKNRESMAHAARACAGSFERILKSNSTIPPLPVLETILAKPPAGELLSTLFQMLSTLFETLAYRSLAKY
jgi:hypothetical protein